MIQLCGCAEAVPFSRSVVQIVGDLIAAQLGNGAHAAALRQVRAEQTVEVFVAATLPGVVWRGEVDLDRESLLESEVVVKLGAVVQRDRLEVCAVAADGSGGCSRHFVHPSRFELLDDRVSSFALHQSQYAVAHVAAHDGIALPMPDTLAQFDLDRPLAYGPLAGQHPA